MTEINTNDRDLRLTIRSIEIFESCRKMAKSLSLGLPDQPLVKVGVEKANVGVADLLRGGEFEEADFAGAGLCVNKEQALQLVRAGVSGATVGSQVQ